LGGEAGQSFTGGLGKNHASGQVIVAERLACAWAAPDVTNSMNVT